MLNEAQAGIKTSRRNINNLRYADDTTLMAGSKEELKSFLLKVKEEGAGRRARWPLVSDSPRIPPAASETPGPGVGGWGGVLSLLPAFLLSPAPRDPSLSLPSPISRGWGRWREGRRASFLGHHVGL